MIRKDCNNILQFKLILILKKLKHFIKNKDIINNNIMIDSFVL
jgi:hypothetical protein